MLPILQADLLLANVPVVAWPLVLGAVGLGLLLRCRRQLRGTTLMGPWVWAVVSLSALVAAETTIAASGEGAAPAWQSALRYAALCTLFCPIMAALGAKRPQDRAWQFVVASLWVVLALPALETLLVRPDQPLAVHTARRWFMLALIVVGAINSVPTRYRFSAVLAVAGQTLLLGRYLPLVPAAEGLWVMPVGLTLLVVAMALVALGVHRRPQASHALDRLWLDFRDSYGALWALRLAERINATAAQYQWNVMLGWRGFRQADTGQGPLCLAPDHARQLEQTLHSLLRRFVSPEWIADRAQQAAAAAEQSS